MREFTHSYYHYRPEYRSQSKVQILRYKTPDKT